MSAREESRENNVDFEDQDLAFDKDLENVGIVVRELKRLVRKCVLRCWLSEEWWKKRDPVNKARLLKKFGGLNFYDPDNDVIYKVHIGNMEYETRHGYVALGVKDRNRDKEEDPTLPFRLPLLCEMIKDMDSSRRGSRLLRSVKKSSFPTHF